MLRRRRISKLGTTLCLRNYSQQKPPPPFVHEHYFELYFASSINETQLKLIRMINSTGRVAMRPLHSACWPDISVPVRAT